MVGLFGMIGFCFCFLIICGFFGTVGAVLLNVFGEGGVIGSVSFSFGSAEVESKLNGEVELGEGVSSLLEFPGFPVVVVCLAEFERFPCKQRSQRTSCEDEEKMLG
jgi:hypothetical protein